MEDGTIFGMDPIKLGAMLAFIFNAWYWSRRKK